MKSLWFCAALALLGCKEGGAESDCASAIGPSVDKMTAAGAKRMEAAAVAPEMKVKMEEASAKLKVAIIHRCTTDKWSADVVDCYKKAEKREDLGACRAKLPEDQAKALHTDELGVMTSLGVGRGMMGGHGGLSGSGGRVGGGGPGPGGVPADLGGQPATAAGSAK
jgi:hypothetical protein